jgi:hypothetical protein
VQVTKDAGSSVAWPSAWEDWEIKIKRTRLATHTARKPGREAHRYGALVKAMHDDNTNETANGMVWE